MKGIKLGDKESKYPIIQGGMGVGVSLHRLAGTVSKEGGIGIISTADIGYQEEDFNSNPMKANLRAIGKEIKKAREIAGEDKILGVNIMVALNNYKEIVKECVKNKIDLIISGAGIPKELPEYVKGSKTKIAPIVSSFRCCQLIVKHWIKKYNYVPDMIVIEGPEAGGHLGFKKEELEEGKKPKLEDITKEVVEYVKEIEKESHKNIPIIAAGGIWDSKDIQKFLNLGATGVQMATRFVTTLECDASNEFKNAYLKATEKDIKIINSPVGMPGRAIYNQFMKQTEKEKCKVEKCYKCIKTCSVSNIPYCITKALINAVKGNMEKALVFCGSNVGKAKEIISVHQLMQELTEELI
ncbi:MAG: nitronate monooxygenase [Clostridia bacterium]|nr:nitronate monooxygenase [Clostridia bacterium]